MIPPQSTFHGVLEKKRSTFQAGPTVYMGDLLYSLKQVTTRVEEICDDTKAQNTNIPFIFSWHDLGTWMMHNTIREKCAERNIGVRSSVVTWSMNDIHVAFLWLQTTIACLIYMLRCSWMGATQSAWWPKQIWCSPSLRGDLWMHKMNYEVLEGTKIPSSIFWRLHVP